MHPEFLAQIAQAYGVGVLGGKRVAGGNAIEFNDAPATELDGMKGGKDGGKIDAAPAQLNPLVAAGRGRVF